MVVALAVGLLLFITIRCSVAFDLGTLANLMAVIGFFLPSLAIIMPRLPKKLRDFLKWFYAGASIVIIILAIVILFLPSPTAGQCLSSALDLIDDERQAVLDENLGVIAKIYDPHAIIRNDATGEQWDNPEAYYSAKFRNEIHCEIVHEDFRVITLTSDTALITTHSRGFWGWQSEDRCTMRYGDETPPNHEEWYFSQEHGRWRIVRFIFNIAP
jgi:hypothetical protein